MKIHLLNSARLKIALNAEDMQLLNIDFEELSFTQDQTRRAIHELLLIAREQTGFDSRHKRMFIEAFPDRDGGCTLKFTLLSGEPPDLSSKHIAKRRNRTNVFEFETVDAVLDALALLRDCAYCCSLYRLDTAYRLLIEDLSDELLPVLCEFGRKLKGGKHSAVFTAEHGVLIAGGQKLLKKSRCSA